MLEEVFKTSGGSVVHLCYANLLLSLRTPGRGAVIEGPSGIGKTTAVEKALTRLGMAGAVTKLCARQSRDVEYIEAVPTLGASGTVIVDDFHKLPDATRAALADYLKTLADEESKETKIIVSGINKGRPKRECICA